MAIESALSAGLNGMHASQRKMVDAAEQVAKAAMPVNQSVGMTPQDNLRQPVEDATESRDLIEPLMEMRRQEQIFTASAQMVSIADKTLGSLIDVTS